MKKISISIFLIITLLSISRAAVTNRPFLCVSGKPLTMSDIAVKTGFGVTIRATVEVKNFHATIITLLAADSGMESIPPIFLECTKQNIGHITYLHDTLSASFTIQYRTMSSRLLSNPYTYLQSDSQIVVVYPRTASPTRDPVVRVVEDTIYLTRSIQAKHGIHGSSKILVQRMFRDNRDSTVIVENNYPELKEAILNASAKFQEKDFLAADKKSKVFMIRFVLIRDLPDCDNYEEF